MGCQVSRSHITRTVRPSSSYTKQHTAQSQVKSSPSTNANNGSTLLETTAKAVSKEQQFHESRQRGSLDLNNAEHTAHTLNKYSSLSNSKNGWKSVASTAAMWKLVKFNGRSLFSLPRTSGQIIVTGSLIGGQDGLTANVDALRSNDRFQNSASGPIRKQLFRQFVQKKNVEEVYHIRGIVGTGFFGDVYRGYHKETNAIVAIKTMPKKIEEEGHPKCNINFQRMFCNEISMLSRLTHPNIIKLKEAYEGLDTLSTVMDFCDGGDLNNYILNCIRQQRRHRKMIRSLLTESSEIPHKPRNMNQKSLRDIIRRLSGPMSEVEIVQLLSAMLRPIAYLHSRGYVHRDIKAQNFLLATIEEGEGGIRLKERYFRNLGSKSSDSASSERGPVCSSSCDHVEECQCSHVVRVVLTDFGMSTKISHGETLSATCGTPHYVAPEVLNRCYGTEVDMWAFGVIVYLMLYGRFPFNAPNPRAILERIKHSTPSFPISSSGPNYWALHFTQRCLKSDPKQRMTAMEALQHPWLQPGKASLEHKYPIVMI